MHLARYGMARSTLAGNPATIAGKKRGGTTLKLSEVNRPFRAHIAPFEKPRRAGDVTKREAHPMATRKQSVNQRQMRRDMAEPATELPGKKYPGQRWVFSR